MTPSLQHKIDFAIKLLQSIPAEDGPVEISYSAGKDSDVILELAKMAGINYRAIYKSTTIDPPRTIAHAKAMGAEILKPTKTFFQLIRENGLPNMFYRYCCKYLKEYKVEYRSVHGVRRAESIKRAKRYKEPEVCRTYHNGEKTKVYLPILEWSDNDVAEFIKERGIKCHPLYYDENGEFHVERRLGCIGCPLQSMKKRRDQFLKYPKILKLWIKNAQSYLNSHTHTKTYKIFDGSVYNWMFLQLFIEDIQEYKYAIGGGIFGEDAAIDPKKYMEDYFGIDLTI